jgi:PhnB protein
MNFIPYLFFDGNCEEALDFYAEVFGGSVEGVMRYSDMPPGAGEAPKGREDRVMNATLKVGEARLMASDSMAEAFEPPRGTSLYMGYTDLERAKRVFSRLAKGGEVRMPFAPTFWSPGFGACRDRFGTEWMIGAEPPPESA